MRTGFGLALVLCLIWSAGSAPAPAQDKGEDLKKTWTVGKDGIKSAGKLTNEKKKVSYAVQMEEGKTYAIRLTSKDFDAYLFVHDDKGKQLDYDDDSGGGTNAFLEFRAPSKGIYTILATSLGMGGTGEYELTIKMK